MGQENSQIDPNAPTRTLSARSIAGIAEYINNGCPKCIAVMAGAGISTSAGIPDFRSPDTGLYANLARLDLPYAEAVFDISYFREHPEPFYVLAKELYPGKFFPTVSHAFMALLDRKSMLQKLFTQNIDCLERRAGVSGGKVVEAHGSFATQRCIDCKAEFPDEEMRVAVMSGKVPHCVVPQCNGLVKPDIVFFGEQLPEVFHQNRDLPAQADLIIVMGTSLSVQPFASLPSVAREKTPRVLINKEAVGDFGSRNDDVLILGDIDVGVRKLADALGWRDELEEMWAGVNGQPKDGTVKEEPALTKDEQLEAEIRKLTGEVDSTLKISNDHKEWVKKALGKSASKEIPLTSTIDLKPSKSEAEHSTPSDSTIEVPTPSPEVIEQTANSMDGTKTPFSAKLTTESATEEKPAQAPVLDTKAILDLTFPQNKL